MDGKLIVNVLMRLNHRECAGELRCGRTILRCLHLQTVTEELNHQNVYFETMNNFRADIKPE